MYRSLSLVIQSCSLTHCRELSVFNYYFREEERSLYQSDVGLISEYTLNIVIIIMLIILILILHNNANISKDTLILYHTRNTLIKYM